jgi:carbon-monoxide dehydrogenase large subunit
MLNAIVASIAARPSSKILGNYMNESSEFRGSILGTRVQRLEDPKLLTGAARYVADLGFTHRAAPLYTVIVRSEVAHGIIRDIHLEEAFAVPGVAAVWTAADLGVAAHTGFVAVGDFRRSPLATDRVRFVGEGVAVVLAETMAAAVDAANAIWVDIDPLAPVLDPETALLPDALVVFPEFGHNQAMMSLDPPVDLESISTHVIRGRFENQRMAVVAMEPNCCAASPLDDGRLMFAASTQMPHVLQSQLATVLQLPIEAVYVVTPQVGGGFGGKAGLHPEHVIVATAALRLDRPVVWVPSRSEDMKALPHSRGQIQYVELGCDDQGLMTGLRIRIVGDAGAHPTVGAMLPAGTKRMAQGNYNISVMGCDVAVAVTTTTPMGAYRGAGRPEATALIERIVDMAARELEIDPIEFRLRNFITEDQFPFSTHSGQVYDSGRYGLALTTAADIVDYHGWRRRQQEQRRGKGTRRLGIGVAAYVEITAGGQRNEYARVEVHEDGGATVYAGTFSHGQGHHTAYAMLLADQTGIPLDRIRLVDGDTDLVPTGGGTGGSRSLQLAGSAVVEASTELVDMARTLAASLLEADVEDVVVDRRTGRIGVAGVPARSLTWAELVTASRHQRAEPSLTAETLFDQPQATFPFGAHISVVEVDLETGKVEVREHVAVDDCGTVINPLLVEGQQHGGIASGIGQALYEHVRFDPEGNPITSNLADYAVVSAAETISFRTHSLETPTPYNPLGAKGIGEAATIGSTPAIQNAVIDALSEFGITHLDMPCTPERVWSALQAARTGSSQPVWREPPPVFVPAAGSGAATPGEVGTEVDI